MNQLDFDGVEAEKAYAMKRYNDRRSFLNILRVAEASAAVALLAYWCFPVSMNSLEISGDWFHGIVSVIGNQSVVFVLINVLIISVLVLSRERSDTETDIYDQYTAATAVVYPVPVVKDYSHDKQIVPVETRIDSTSAAARRPRKTVTAVEEEDHAVVRSDEAVTEVKEVRSYRRTQSERRGTSTEEEQQQVVRRVEYRRSSATVKRTERGSAWVSHAVDGLSNEEFRVTVERFIREKKRTLLHENDAVVQRRGHSGQSTGSSSRSCSCLVRTQ